MSATIEDLKSVERLIAALSPTDRKILEKAVAPQLKLWMPLPGPQTMAYESEAEILLYGGSAGGGKSSLLLGAAINDHSRALILRRETVELDGLIADSRLIVNGKGTFNGQDKEWSLPDTRSLKFGGMREADDWRKYAGRARDYIGFDEAAEFQEVQVASILAWLRSAKAGQRCRAILATNPPRSAEGEWIIRWFAPWLDGTYHNPAAPGELRWCITLGEEIRWVDGPGEYTVDGEQFEAVSRTFIPAKLDDNLYLSDTDYRKRLQNLTGPLRAQLLKGDFSVGRSDDEWQVIPTDWIRQAQERWKPDGHKGFRMTAIAADVAQGGEDHTVIAYRYGVWYAPLIDKAGIDTPDPPSVAALITTYRRDGAAVVIDVGGGYGGGAVSWLKENEVTAIGFNGANGSTRTSADGSLRFVNARAESWWRMREALDPSQEGGSPLCLPPDPALLADLSAPRWSLKTRGIQIEEKAEIKKRLGRSPDKGDAVTMAWSQGQALAERKLKAFINGRLPQTNVGYSNMKRR